ncbi:MAG: helix-turn-helix transcriptional regulator [Ignavibacteriales bacterium]|nr:helix-turn-helix transcriptional regulator [Ignavibacteriales bacterium]
MIIEHKQYDLFGKMLFEKVILTPPFTKFNSMPNEACFLYIIEGETKHISAIELLRVPAKESVLFKCGNYISQMFASPPSKKYMALAVHFHPEVLKKIYDKELPKFLQGSKSVSRNSDTVKIKSDLLLQKYIDGMLFYFENPALVNEEILILKLKEIILLLNQTKDAPAVQQILSTLFSPTTYSFKEIIDSHLFSNITIQELSQLTNLSLSSFKREFKKIFGDSPASYIKNKKLERAKELLLISGLRIGDIAYDCGFEDIAHFSHSFKKNYSISPTNFRLTQKDKSLS